MFDKYAMKVLESMIQFRHSDKLERRTALAENQY